MPSSKQTYKQIIGKIGENLACDFLKKKGYEIIDRNYLRKWGEIDIVGMVAKTLHFVEVKTVSCDTTSEKLGNISQISGKVTHETPVVEQGSLQGELDDYRPEDNIHPWKLQRLGRVVQSYLLDKDVSDEIEWQFDVITVYLDKDKKLIKIEMLEDIVL